MFVDELCQDLFSLVAGFSLEDLYIPEEEQEHHYDERLKTRRI